MSLNMRRGAPRQSAPRGFDQLPRQIDRENTTSSLIVTRIQRRFGLSAELAVILAELAFRVEAPR